MTSYDYYDAMKEDIREYLEENGAIDRLLADDADRDEIEEELRNELWTADSVTGNASGSYTFNSWKAKGYVLDNMERLKDALEEFCIEPSEIGERFLNDEWEYFDVTIRCYLLDVVLSDVIDEIMHEYSIPRF